MKKRMLAVVAVVALMSTTVIAEGTFPQEHATPGVGQGQGSPHQPATPEKKESASLKLWKMVDACLRDRLDFNNKNNKLEDK